MSNSVEEGDAVLGISIISANDEIGLALAAFGDYGMDLSTLGFR